MVVTAPEPELFDTTGMWTPVEFDKDKHDRLADAYRHADGSITYIVYDDDGSAADPRDFDGNIATLIQRNDRCIDIDADEAGLQEARDHWAWLDQRHRLEGCACEACGRARRVYGNRLRGHDRDALMRRYLAIYRPDIAYYTDYWSAGDSYGWGYVTTQAWRENMYPEPGNTAESVDYFLRYQPTVTPEEAFDGEVKVYRQWAEGEVYGYIHEEPNGSEDSCWGFLGYEDHKEIASEATESEITDTLY